MEIETYSKTRRQSGGVQVQRYSFFNLGPECDGWSTRCPHHFTPGNDPVRNVQKAWWAQGRSGWVWNIYPLTSIRTQYRTPHSSSLYRLRFPCRSIQCVLKIKRQKCEAEPQPRSSTNSQHIVNNGKLSVSSVVYRTVVPSHVANKRDIR